MSGSLLSHGSELSAGIALLRLSSAAVLLAQSGYVLIVVSDHSGSPVADAGTRSLIIVAPKLRGHFSASASIPQHSGEAQAFLAGSLVLLTNVPKMIVKIYPRRMCLSLCLSIQQEPEQFISIGYLISGQLTLTDIKSTYLFSCGDVGTCY